MKKLFSLLLAISAVALLSSASFAATSGNFGVSAVFGDGASIMLYSDNEATVEMTDLLIDTTGIHFPATITDYPELDNDGAYVGFCKGKTYVQVTGSGTSWAVITYTSNNPDTAGLMHTVDNSKAVLFKYVSSTKGTPIDLDTQLSHAEFNATTWFVNLSSAETYSGQDTATQAYMQCILPTEVSSTDIVDISLIIGLTRTITTPGEYSTTVNFEVVSN